MLGCQKWEKSPKKLVKSLFFQMIFSEKISSSKKFEHFGGFKIPPWMDGLMEVKAALQITDSKYKKRQIFQEKERKWHTA